MNEEICCITEEICFITNKEKGKNGYEWMGKWWVWHFSNFMQNKDIKKVTNPHNKYLYPKSSKVSS